MDNSASRSSSPRNTGPLPLLPVVPVTPTTDIQVDTKDGQCIFRSSRFLLLLPHRRPYLDLTLLRTDTSSLIKFTFNGLIEKLKLFLGQGHGGLKLQRYKQRLPGSKIYGEESFRKVETGDYLC
jgi:hypothetical protein